MYGKLIDESLIYAPNPMESRGDIIYNPTAEQYKSEGYLPIVEVDYPNDGKYYECNYVERDGVIYRDWVEAVEPKREPSLEERVALTESQITDTQLALCEVYEMLL